MTYRDRGPRSLNAQRGAFAPPIRHDRAYINLRTQRDVLRDSLFLAISGEDTLSSTSCSLM